MKHPRFFCEHCGAEVSRETKHCPRCGRYFASVRCPACGFVGEEGIFKGGCPVCGYSAASGRDGGDTKPLRKEGVENLPLWVYVLAGSMLLAVFGFLFFTLV
ncbi:MAG: zinc ribbon domain-containing protein [Spirochaetaceae bacterium]|nr:zinc ribbon domain-containing protein [Spirochaetaceae bacterium]